MPKIRRSRKEKKPDEEDATYFSRYHLPFPCILSLVIALFHVAPLLEGTADSHFPTIHHIWLWHRTSDCIVQLAIDFFPLKMEKNKSWTILIHKNFLFARNVNRSSCYSATESINRKKKKWNRIWEEKWGKWFCVFCSPIEWMLVWIYTK